MSQLNVYYKSDIQQLKRKIRQFSILKSSKANGYEQGSDKSFPIISACDFAHLDKVLGLRPTGSIEPSLIFNLILKRSLFMFRMIP